MDNASLVMAARQEDRGDTTGYYFGGYECSYIGGYSGGEERLERVLQELLDEEPPIGGIRGLIVGKGCPCNKEADNEQDEMEENLVVCKQELSSPLVRSQSNKVSFNYVSGFIENYVKSIKIIDD